MTKYRISMTIMDLRPDNNYGLEITGFKAIGEVMFDYATPNQVKKMDKNAVAAVLRKWSHPAPLICKYCLEWKTGKDGNKRRSISLFELQPGPLDYVA